MKDKLLVLYSIGIVPVMIACFCFLVDMKRSMRSFTI